MGASKMLLEATATLWTGLLMVMVAGVEMRSVGEDM